MSTTGTYDVPGTTTKPPAAPLPWLAAPFAFIGSLTLGIFLLVLLLFLLACGTFIETEYGSDVARFVLYGNLWFAVLFALLALNLVFNILGHFPWRRRGIAYLTVHLGILLLLFGCYRTFRYGVEAKVTLPEGVIGYAAVRPERQQFEFKYIVHSFASVPNTFSLPFSPGPFSWQDYQYDNWIKSDGRRYKTILWYAMQLGHRDIGELSSGDPNVHVEVLDYFAHSTLEPVPPFDANILWKKNIPKVTELGETKETPRNWESVRLEPSRSAAGLPDVRGSSTTMSQGERVSYSLAVSQEELTAFRSSRPKEEGNAGLWGEIILYYGGKHYSVNVEQLLNLAENKRFSVKGSGLQIGNVRFRDRGPIISFSLFTSSGKNGTMVLFPDNPEWNMQARELGIFGSYWVNPHHVMQHSAVHADSPTLQRLALPRLDFMQGPDKKLYYRLWSGQNIIADGIVPDREGQTKPQFKVAAQTSDEVEIVIERFVPQDVPGCRVVAAPATMGQQRAKLRVVFDGKEDTFWIRAAQPTVVPLPPDQDQVRYIYGNERTLAVTLNFENIDLGFGILLKTFEQRSEPGTRMSYHFSSLVDYVEPITSADAGATFSRELENLRTLPNGADVSIAVNRPGYCRGKGLGYRIYQSSYLGPFYPNQPEFQEFYDGTIFPWENRPRESIAMSTLSVNNDPGRGWKYIGCFLIVLGTALFYLRKKHL